MSTPFDSKVVHTSEAIKVGPCNIGANIADLLARLAAAEQTILTLTARITALEAKLTTLTSKVG